MASPKRYIAKDGQVTWRVRFRHGKKQTTETFTTEADAKRFSADLNSRGADFALKMRIEELEAERGDTLEAIAEDFFTWKVTRVRSDRTVADYRRDFDNWIRPTLGRRLASSIDEADVQTWVDGMHAGTLDPKRRPLAAKSVIDRHALLHQIYAWAMAPSRRRVVHNPCVGTDLPKKRKGMPKGLRPAEWQALHVALEQINPAAADLCLFLLASGWRWSEATALEVADVEDDGTHVWVSAGRVIRRNAANQFVAVVDAKGEGSLRRIGLDPEASAMVRRRVASLPLGGLVFTTETGAQWHYANFKRRIWDSAVTAAGLDRKPTPHWLRHTSVVWLAQAGASLPELQSRIGHKSIKTTIDVYGRMIQDVQRGALEGFAAMRSARPQVAGETIRGEITDG